MKNQGTVQEQFRKTFESGLQNEALRRSKYQREAKGIDATYFLQIL
jgi:hypothetical protein